MFPSSLLISRGVVRPRATRHCLSRTKNSSVGYAVTATARMAPSAPRPAPLRRCRIRRRAANVVSATLACRRLPGSFFPGVAKNGVVDGDGDSSAATGETARRRSSSNAAAATAAPARREAFGAGGLSRLLTDDQRTLLREIWEVSSLARALAKDVGNVPAREDGLLADIGRAQRRGRRRSEQRQSDGDGESGIRSGVVDDDDDLGGPPSTFTVVLAGEFNSGKSTVVNALLGRELLETGPLPTTDAITVLTASTDDGGDEDVDGEGRETDANGEFERYNAQGGTVVRFLPRSSAPLLSDLCLVDTPGTNALLSLRHTATTMRVLHDADLILFVTSADRPFSESERELLQKSAAAYRKRVVVVINKMDVLERTRGEDHGSETKRRVVDYVVEGAADLLGARPVVIAVSARDALSAKSLFATAGGRGDGSSTSSSSGLWHRSNFAALEEYLSSTLTASSKIKTKLLNPLGVADGILIECKREVERRADELETDLATLRLLEGQTLSWKRDVKTDVLDRCRTQMTDVWKRRSERYGRLLDETSHLDRWRAALSRAYFNEVWDRSERFGGLVSGLRGRSDRSPSEERSSLEQELFSVAHDCADALAVRAKDQGEATVDYLGKRPAVVSRSSPSGDRSGGRGGVGIGRMVGTVSSPKFGRIEEDFRNAASRAIEGAAANAGDDSADRDHAFGLLRRTALTSAVLFCGGSSIPAALSAAAVLDAATGTATSGAFLVLGILAVPIGNDRAVQSYKNNWMSHAKRLDDSISTMCDEAMQRIGVQLSESVAPYARYVRSEGDGLRDLTNRTENTMASAHSLRSRISKATSEI